MFRLKPDADACLEMKNGTSSRSYDDAINTIIGLIESAGQKLGKAKNEKQLVEASRVLEWAGRLREYATTATLEKDRISEIDAEKIDNAAKAAGQRANRMFEKGRFFVADKAEDFDKAINNVTVKSAKINIRNKKIKLSNYASFNIPLAISLNSGVVAFLNIASFKGFDTTKIS